MPSTPALAFGRQREGRATRLGRDSDCRFSAKRSRGRDSVAVAAISVPADGLCVCFHAIAQARVVGLAPSHGHQKRGARR